MTIIKQPYAIFSKFGLLKKSPIKIIITIKFDLHFERSTIIILQGFFHIFFIRFMGFSDMTFSKESHPYSVMKCFVLLVHSLERLGFGDPF